jgi:phage terminase large subunit GpA-like protein
MIADASWRSALRPADRRPIADWAHDHVILPPAYQQPGRFDVSTSRHLLGPLAAIQDDAIREASWMGAIQTGKTLAVEIGLMWATCNSPGPIMWTMQTDEDADEHCNERFMEAYTGVPDIAAMMPENRHLKQTSAVYFGPFFLKVNGANMNNLQRVSIRWKFNSEVWLWKQGLLTHARGRVSAFEKSGNSKVINESQGGTFGDDFDQAWREGNQQVWSARCFACGQLSPLEFAGRMTDDPKKFAGVIWDEAARRQDGSWAIGRAAETARWRCPRCGGEHDNSARTRARWNAEGEYVPGRTDAPPSIVSFRWEALLARDMGLLVAQFLEARKAQKSGVPQAMMDFTRQRRALPWIEEDLSEIILLKGSGYLLAGLVPAAKIENEANRFCTIDRQRDHFWVVVRAWRRDGSSRLLYFSRVTTPEQCEDIRREYTVEPQLCFEDTGYFPEGGYTDCTQYGWTALKGSGDNYFTIETRAGKIKRLWSNASMVQHNGKVLPLFHWASDPIKDVLYNLRGRRGVLWETPDDIGAEYPNQLAGDHKRQTKNKRTGRPEWRWTRRHPNHAHDLEAMQTVVAMMLGVLAAPAVKADEPEETPVAVAPGQ